VCLSRAPGLARWQGLGVLSQYRAGVQASRVYAATNVSSTLSNAHCAAVGWRGSNDLGQSDTLHCVKAIALAVTLMTGVHMYVRCCM
jgi:hypothetical protein